MNAFHGLIGTSWESSYTDSTPHLVSFIEATHLTLGWCLHVEPTSPEQDEIGPLAEWLLSNNPWPNVVNKLKPSSGVWFL